MAFFEIQNGAIVRLNNKISLFIKFKSEDGLRDSGVYQLHECEFDKEEDIKGNLQKTANDWERAPIPDVSIPTLPIGSWTQVSLDEIP